MASADSDDFSDISATELGPGESFALESEPSQIRKCVLGLTWEAVVRTSSLSEFFFFFFFLVVGSYVASTDFPR